jgi:hypothetical protein
MTTFMPASYHPAAPRARDYVILREALDTPGLRMTYCEGALELMSPSAPTS